VTAVPVLSVERPGRAAKIVIAVVAVVGVAALPAHVEHVRRDASLLRLWFDPDAQQRLALGPLYDFLRAADAILPADASVLLLTSGRDVRHAEYTAFHRALYFLTPRPVSWMTPAPSDGTWESRWWISAPLTAPAVLSTAAAKRATHLLAFDLPAPPAVGEKIADLPGGAVFALAPGARLAAAATLAAAPPTQVPRWWPLRLVAALLVIVLVGYNVVALIARFGWVPSRLEAVALAWTFGAGVTSLLMYWLQVVGVPLGRQPVIVTIAALAGMIACRWRRGTGHSMPGLTSPPQRHPASPAQRAAVIVLGSILAVLILLVAVEAIGRPLTVWDSWVLWGMRARTIFVENGISPAVYADPSRAVTLLHYPLLFACLEAWIYAWLGAPDDRLAGIIAVLCYAALPAVAYAAMRRRGADRPWALCTAVALSAVPSLVWLASSGFAESAAALFAAVAAIYLLEWLEGGPAGALIAAALAAGCLPWTKREGVVLVAALIVATLVLDRASRRARNAALALGGAAVLLSGPWYAFVAAEGLPVPEFSAATIANLWANLDRVPSIVRHGAGALLTRASGWIWPLALVFGVVCRRSMVPLRPIAILPLAALLYLAAIASTYLFSTYVPYQQHVLSSFFRVSAQVVALPLLWIALHAARR
jgi:hypothetical protein